jgi:hypothetical protein
MNYSPDECSLSPYQYFVFCPASEKERSGCIQVSIALVCMHRLCSKDFYGHDERADPK